MCVCLCVRLNMGSACVCMGVGIHTHTCGWVYVSMGAHVDVDVCTWVWRPQAGLRSHSSGAILFCCVESGSPWPTTPLLGWLASKPPELACLCLPRASITSTCLRVLYTEFKSSPATSSSGNGLSLNWHLTILERVPGQCAPGVPLSLSPNVGDTDILTAMPSFLHRCWRFKL